MTERPVSLSAGSLKSFEEFIQLFIVMLLSFFTHAKQLQRTGRVGRQTVYVAVIALHLAHYAF